MNLQKLKTDINQILDEAIHQGGSNFDYSRLGDSIGNCLYKFSRAEFERRDVLASALVRIAADIEQFDRDFHLK